MMAAIDKQRWARISPLLDELLDAAPTQRAQRLAQLRADDRAFADEIVALLAQESEVETEHFLADAVFEPEVVTLAGRALGAWTLERPIGHGGMGSVWLARRNDGRFEGQAAVKLLNLALIGRGGAERFQREGNALARLAHPAIARLLDAGVHEGQPYLVLEYIAGEPIDRWCDARRLDLRARVSLMLDVLAAVAHAHGKLILHRDLKPSNILVTAEGQVKLLDFGIAKLIEDPTQSSAASDLTREAGRAFTPEYAAPEQMHDDEVTTATDVYALGVLLYLLLTGSRPQQGKRRTLDTRFAEISAFIPDPDLPSVRALGADAAAADARATTPLQLARALRGDLDNIVNKAIKRAVTERYATATELADDLRRYLDHQPVRARRDSMTYRAGKFLRRNRFTAGAALALLLTLTAGIVGTTREAQEAQRQRADALAQRDRAQALLGRNEAIAEFIGIMFTDALPAGQAKAVQEMLERSEPLIDTAFGSTPAHQAEVLRVLASYYTALSLPNKQFELLSRARDIVERVPDRSLKARLACDQANAASVLGKPDEAIALLDQWIDAPDLEPAVAASCLQRRAQVAQNSADAKGALAFAEAGLRRLRDSGASAPLLEVALLGDVGFAQHLAGRNGEADRSYQSALDRLRALGRSDSFVAQRLAIDRGVVRYAMSDYKGGLELFEQALKVAERQGGAVIPPGIVANRAFGLEQLGRYEEALAGYDRTYDASKRNGFVGGEAYALVGRASVLTALGRVAPAQASLDQASPLLQGLPTAHSARIRHSVVQARIDVARGDLAAADQRFGAVIELLSAKGAATPALVNAYRQHAEVLLKRGDRQPALAEARKAVELARKLQGGNPHSDDAGHALLALGQVLRYSGDDAGAREALTAAQRELMQTVGAEHPATRLASQLLSSP